MKEGISYGSRTSGIARAMIRSDIHLMAGIALEMSESVSMRKALDSGVRLSHPSMVAILSKGRPGVCIKQLC